MNTPQESKTQRAAVAHQRLVQQGLKWLIGLTVKSSHPITCANPSPTFKIHEARIDEQGKLFVRGEETIWFHGDMISLPNDKDLARLALDSE